MATITTAGAVPATPQELRDAEVAAATALSPGLTANLPGSLIEDLASTAAGALVIQDQAYVDLVNSISPYSANPFILSQLGNIYGVQQGIGANTSVYVTFIGDPGYVIPAGFTVSDGNYQYTVQAGGIVQTDGQSAPLYCLATQSGSWAVPIGTVTQIITSVASGFTLNCTNLTAGVPGEIAQTVPQYQAQVIQAGLAVAQGMPTFLRTQLEKVVGVQARLISIRAVGIGEWEIIVGGGDPFAVANAIYEGIFDISNIVGSTILADSITQDYPAVVTTNLNHGYTTGQAVIITGATGMTEVNNNTYIAIVNDEKTFSLNVPIFTITWSGGTVTVTTSSNHGLPVGTTAGHIYGCSPTAFNGAYTFTRTGATTFTYPLVSDPGTATTKGYTELDSAAFTAYTGDGVVSPNLRNITVSITDFPDTYSITFVNPPVQTVGVALVWNTDALNYVSPTAVAQLGIPAIVDYVNNVYVGQPLNIFEMQRVFENSISNIIPSYLVSRMVFTVTINGILTVPLAGTGLIYGDSESYFETNPALVTVTQG
ncbi:MAG: hypothetical protein ACOYMH_00125 [Zwartia sp.]